MPIKIKSFVKALFRSGDLPFALAFAGKPGGDAVRSFRWRTMDFHYRPGTSDAHVAYECFLHRKRNAYASKNLPKREDVKTVVDVGANVGASILFWRSLYPVARIYGFEPEPGNFEMLRRNTERLRDVHVFNEALGDATGEMKFIHSPGAGNEGGWSTYQRGAQGGEKVVVLPVVRGEDRMKALGITRIDVLKVDTEGAERLVLAGLGKDLLAGTGYVCGELHGERDFELLDTLERSGFKIGVKKNLRSVLFNFEAKR
jgi:FkbM family methyltransferase